MNSDILFNAKIDKILNIFLIALIAIMAGVYVLTAFFLPIHTDAAYYLGVTELIHENIIPYRDFHIYYVPVGFYVLQPFRMLMGDIPDYSVYLLAFYAFIMLAAYFLYRIVKIISQNKTFSLLAALLFSIQNYFFEGQYVVLEPLVVLFGLISIFILLRKVPNNTALLLSGLFAGLAFLTKQYGLAFFAGNALFLLLSKGLFVKKIKNIIFLSLGFAVFPALLIVYFLSAGVSAQVLVDSVLLGSGYGLKSFRLLAEGILKLLDIRYFLTIFILPVFILLIRKKKNLALPASLAAVCLLFSYQFYFQVFPHYFLLLIPCIIILFSFSFTFAGKMLKYCAVSLLAIHCLIMGFSVFTNAGNTLNEKKRSLQYARVTELEKHIENENEIYCNGYNSVPYYFILHRKPVLFSKYGYEFGHYEPERQQIERIEAADVVIIDSHTFDYFYPQGSAVRAAMDKKQTIYKDSKVMLRK